MRFFVFALLSIFVLSVFSHAQSHDFEVSPPVIKILLDEGEISTLLFSVLNTGGDQDFTIHTRGDFFYSEISGIFIGNMDNVDIPLVIGKPDLKAGAYIGEAVVSSSDKEFSIPVVLEVGNKGINLALSTYVPVSSVEISPGEDFISDVKIHNLYSLEQRVIVNYEIVKTSGEVIIEDSEYVNVKDSVQLTKVFSIPEDSAFGDYVFAVTAIQGDSVATKTVVFSYSPIMMSPTENSGRFALPLSFAVIAALIIAFLLFNYYWTRRLKENALYWSKHTARPKTKSNGVKQEMQKLSYQRELLQKAYEKGYIKKDSYEEGINRLDSFVKRLKKRL